MKVQFRRLYFGPNKARYKPGRVHDLPREWFGEDLKLLPKGAKVFDDPPAPAPAKDPPKKG